jgi:hypothetical protein
MRNRLLWLVVPCMAALVLTVQNASSNSQPIVPKLIASGALRPAVIHTSAGVKRLPFLSAGIVASIKEGSTHSASALSAGSTSGDQGFSVGSLGCRERAGGRNVRVNQDCTYRRQAETAIASNPEDPKNLVGGMNDSIIGWNQTSLDFSLDGGAHWGAISTAPFRYRLNAPEDLLPTSADPNRHTILGTPGTLHSYDACSDPYLSFDSEGRAFYTCIAFDVATNASMVFVTPSPKGARGSYFDQVPAPFGISPPYSGREHMVDEENSAAASLDGPKVQADSYVHSPNRDNIYSTFTRFNFTCGKAHDQYCYSTIYASMSTDHGVTWSTPRQVSGTSRALCVLGNSQDPSQPASACNFNGHSDIAVEPNGDVVISYQNGNTPGTDQQVLAVHCHPTGSSPSGTAHLNCGSPHRVATQVWAHAPICDFSDVCSPGAYVRVPIETSQRIAVDQKTGDLYDVWYDYRAGEFDIFAAKSTDGGTTWSAPRRVNPDRGRDHYFGAVDVKESSHTLAVSYFRTSRVPNENKTPKGGFSVGDPGVQKEPSDYVMAWGSTSLNSAFQFKVLSPEFPPPDGIQAGFNGDYTDIDVGADGTAHPIWSDTRVRVPNPAFNKATVDEDSYTEAVKLP